VTVVVPPGPLGITVSQTIPAVVYEVDEHSVCRRVPDNHKWYLHSVNGENVKAKRHHELLALLGSLSGQERTLVFQVKFSAFSHISFSLASARRIRDTHIAFVASSVALGILWWS